MDDRIPERAHRTEAVDDRREDLQNVIDVALVVCVAEAQAQGTVRDLVLEADGEQHVARVERAAGAGAAGRSADALEVEHQEQRFALDAFKAEADVAGQALLAVAVEAAAVDLQDLVDQPVLHAAELRVLFLHGRDRVLHRDAESDDAGDILRAGAAGSLLCAAVDQVRDRDAAADVQRADALRGVELVAAQGEHVDVLRLDVDRHVADSLYRIGVEEHAVLLADRADFGDRLDRADLVVRVHDRDERGLVGDGGFELLGHDDAVFMHVEVGDGEAFLFQCRAGVQHGVVLEFAGDDVRLALGFQLVRDAFDGPVVAFAAARGEIDLVRVGAEAAGDLLARLLQRLLCGIAERVEARGVAVELLIKRQHRVEHSGGDSRGGGVVCINNSLAVLFHSVYQYLSDCIFS